MPNPFQVLIGQYRLGDLQTHVFACIQGVQQIRPGTDQTDQGHDQFLPDGIDGRIGHLGEVLFEVGGKMFRPQRQHRRWIVSAHGAGGFLSGHDHRRQQELDVLLAVAEGLLVVQ